MSTMVRVAWIVAFALAWAPASRAAAVSVAVAANFAGPMQRIARAFERETGHKAVLAFGATGALYAQIRNGAPFQVMLAADAEIPARLEREGLGVPGSRFTYATGRLVLWSPQAGRVDDRGEILRSGSFTRLALANPKLAPYGAAAIETMRRLGVLDALRSRMVQGENVAQVHQFVASGNAELGFLALSQVTSGGGIAQGSGWIVPEGLHAPLRQDAVLLASGKGQPAAEALLDFLKRADARAIIVSHGYAP